LRAVDEDICPLRASRPIQAAVQSAAERNGIPLIDFPTLLEQEVEQGHGHRIAGAESFLDQVHPTIDVHLRLAWEIRDQLTTLRLARPVADREDVAQRVKERVLGNIVPRDHALALIQVVRVLGWTGKSDETFRLLDRAEEIHPGLSEVANYRGSLLEKLGRPDEARQCYLEAVQRDPEDAMAQTNLGYVELAAGQFASARDHFRIALQCISPTASNAFRARLHRGLGTTYARLRLREAAIAELEAAVRLAPGDLAAQKELRGARVPAGDASPRGTDR
jgi:tetratricopeptide (TPR) repeat protein